MKRVVLLIAAASIALLLAWWLLRGERGPDGPPSAASTPVEAASPDGSSGSRGSPSGSIPAVHLPQIQAGPDDLDPEAVGPSNLPPGTQRTRYAASGKLAHYVIEEYADSFRECFQQHRAAAPELPERALLEFRIVAEPSDTGAFHGEVREVQILTGGPDYDLMEHNSFEFCCTEAVIGLELDPPGGRAGGEMKFGMTIDLASGELVDEARGQGQAQ